MPNFTSAAGHVFLFIDKTGCERFKSAICGPRSCLAKASDQQWYMRHKAQIDDGGNTEQRDYDGEDEDDNSNDGEGVALCRGHRSRGEDADRRSPSPVGNHGANGNNLADIQRLLMRMDHRQATLKDCFAAVKERMECVERALVPVRLVRSSIEGDLDGIGKSSLLRGVPIAGVVLPVDNCFGYIDDATQALAINALLPPASLHQLLNRLTSVAQGLGPTIACSSLCRCSVLANSAVSRLSSRRHQRGQKLHGALLSSRYGDARSPSWLLGFLDSRYCAVDGQLLDVLVPARRLSLSCGSTTSSAALRGSGLSTAVAFA